MHFQFTPSKVERSASVFHIYEQLHSQFRPANNTIFKKNERKPRTSISLYVQWLPLKLHASLLIECDACYLITVLCIAPRSIPKSALSSFWDVASCVRKSETPSQIHWHALATSNFVFSSFWKTLSITNYIDHTANHFFWQLFAVGYHLNWERFPNIGMMIYSWCYMEDNNYVKLYWCCQGNISKVCTTCFRIIAYWYFTHPIVTLQDSYLITQCVMHRSMIL